MIVIIIGEINSSRHRSGEGTHSEMVEVVQSHGEREVGELGAQRGRRSGGRGGPRGRSGGRHGTPGEPALEAAANIAITL